MSSTHSTSTSDANARDGAGALHDAPNDLSTEPLPPPRTAVLLGLAFGASAGLLTALYLLLS